MSEWCPIPPNSISRTTFVYRTILLCGVGQGSPNEMSPIFMAVQGLKDLNLLMRPRPGRHQLPGGWPLQDGTLLAAVASRVTQ